MKRRALFILAVLALPLVMPAQNMDCEDQMIACFGEVKFNALMAENSAEADFHCFQNLNGYYITDLPPGKTSDSFPDLLSLESLNEDIFPALTLETIESGVFLAGYGIEVKQKSYRYYTVGITDQLFVVYPQELIRTLFDNQ